MTSIPSDASDISVEGLIQQARNGDEEGLGSLLEFYRGYLLSIANRDIDRDISVKVPPSDVVQNVLAQAHKSYNQFEGDSRLRFTNWLKRILQNEIASVKRQFVRTKKRKLAKEVSLPASHYSHNYRDRGLEDSLTPSRPLVQQESLLLYRTALSRLPDHYRQIIQLRIDDNKSLKEIAELMDGELASIQKLWARAVDHFRRELLKSDPNYYERL